jgi:hypothetical protein
VKGFTELALHLDGDGAYAADVGRAVGGRITDVAWLADGTSGGEPSVALRILTAEGDVVIAETTWRLMAAALRAGLARYPAP